MTVPQQAWSSPDPHALIEKEKTRWVQASIAGLVVGLVAAGLYALISVTMKSEILFLIIGVGAAVGLVVVYVAKVDNVVTGLISLGIGAISLGIAIYLYVTSFAWGSLPSALSHFGDMAPEYVFESYFSDPLGYVWVAAGLIAAYYCGSGQIAKNKTVVRTDPIVDTLGEENTPPGA